MCTITLRFVLFFYIFDATNAARRIRDGLPVTINKTYVVYFVKAPISPRKYDSWLCGGALVSKEFIVTSAACVDDVEFLYAIAGYDTYVADNEIEKDECTKTNKKKVVYTCTPVAFELQYDRLEKWSYIDIALAKVESPYDFTLKTGCSYIPSIIAINYEKKYQEPGIDAMVLGWGHLKVWRKPGDQTNYNQKKLHYAPCLLADKEDCKKKYEAYTNMTRVIDEYMICSMSKGNINDQGETIMKSPPTAEGCLPTVQKLSGLPGTSCEFDDYTNYSPIDHTRRNLSEAIKAYNESMNTVLANKSIFKIKEFYKDEDNITTSQDRPHTKSTVVNNSKLKIKNVFKDKSNKTNNRSFNESMNNEFRNHSILKIKEFYMDEVNETADQVYNESMKSKFTNHSSLRVKGFRNIGRNLASVGICQNDHGGPLVTWVGAHEVLIGVASVFKVSPESECEGPYLYTSTQCNGAFLDCVLTNSKSLPGGRSAFRSGQRAICDSPPKLRGYDTVERHISWKHHPAGPADNEKFQKNHENSDENWNEHGNKKKKKYGSMENAGKGRPAKEQSFTVKTRLTQKSAGHWSEEIHSVETRHPITSTRTKKKYGPKHMPPIHNGEDTFIVRPQRPLSSSR